MLSHKSIYTTVFALSLALVSANARNITINDMQLPNSSTFGAPGIGQGGEDQETEPRTIGNQAWDLEAFTLNGNQLRIYSGYNLLAGEHPYGLGDLFIDVSGDANWQPGTDNGLFGNTGNDVFKFDYVLHFTQRSGISIGTGLYDIYKLSGTASEQFKQTEYKSGSNPYHFLPGHQSTAQLIGSGQMLVNYDANDTIVLEDGTKVTGGGHYIGGIDLSFLAPGEINSSTLFKITHACGNDSLVGRVPDAGSAMTLLSGAMAGMSFFTRMARRKS
ncbi:MAG: hypothetical protein FJ405_02565 [Verrucomicrobia bacterium]|nr:hypothetical protein [Verrucomicrobiota bacterium]